VSKIRWDKVSLIRSSANLTKEVLKAVSLTVNKGEVYTILGPSGSGKSTLLRLINRLIEPSSGEIYLDNINIREIPVIELRRRIGLVFQQPVLFPGSVQENINYSAKIQGKNFAQAAEYLTMVGLDSELLTMEVSKLSGGQQQRVALARALANKPEVLLLDEPTSALDIQATEQLEALIVNLVKTLGLTVLWVTHNIDQAKRVGDRTMLLVDGRVIEDRVTPDFFNFPREEIAVEFLAGKLKTRGN